MNPSFVRIHLPLKDALPRFSNWLGLPELGPPTEVRGLDAVKEACDGDSWRSKVAVFIYESSGWTVFEDFTGHLGTFSASQWRNFAGAEDLVFAGYNDAIPYGQLIVIQDKQIVRDFQDDQQDPKDNRDVGRLPEEEDTPIKDWIGVAGRVDEDEFAMSPDDGLLWLLGPV